MRFINRVLDSDRICKFMISPSRFVLEYRSRYYFPTCGEDPDPDSNIGIDRRPHLAAGVMQDLAFYSRYPRLDYSLRLPRRFELPQWCEHARRPPIFACHFDRIGGVLLRLIGPNTVSADDVVRRYAYAAEQTFNGMAIDDDEGQMYASHVIFLGSSQPPMSGGVQ